MKSTHMCAGLMEEDLRRQRVKTTSKPDFTHQVVLKCIPPCASCVAGAGFLRSQHVMYRVAPILAADLQRRYGPGPLRPPLTKVCYCAAMLCVNASVLLMQLAFGS
jgi:hypothetical protein